MGFDGWVVDNWKVMQPDARMDVVRRFCLSEALLCWPAAGFAEIFVKV